MCRNGCFAKNDFDTLMNELSCPDARFVRPSGNPISNEGFKEMMSSADVAMDQSEILSFNKIHIGADSAMACVTHHDVFVFKGNPNDDISVSTFYLVKEGTAWKVMWGQRSTGRKPDEPKPEGF